MPFTIHIILTIHSATYKHHDQCIQLQAFEHYNKRDRHVHRHTYIHTDTFRDARTDTYGHPYGNFTPPHTDLCVPHCSKYKRNIRRILFIKRNRS